MFDYIELEIHRSLRYPFIHRVVVTKGNHEYGGLLKKKKQMEPITIACFFQIHQGRSISKIISKVYKKTNMTVFLSKFFYCFSFSFLPLCRLSREDQQLLLKSHTQTTDLWPQVKILNLAAPCFEHCQFRVSLHGTHVL